jgi:hypothetical protein
MVDNQTVNKRNKHLKKRINVEKKKTNNKRPCFRNSRISVLVVLLLLLQHPVLLVSISGRFGAGVWWCWSTPVGAQQVAPWLACRAAAGVQVGCWPGGLVGGQQQHEGGGPPALSVYHDVEKSSTG